MGINGFVTKVVISADKTEEVKKTEDGRQKTEDLKKDTVVADQPKKVAEIVGKADTATIEKPKKVEVVAEQPKKQDSIAPSKRAEPIVTKENVTVYAVQVAASKTYLEPAYFKNKFKLTDSVWYFEKDGWYKYTTGQFATQKEAVTKLTQLGISGFVTKVDKAMLKNK
ncbi:MAG: hypothetical protein NTV01_17195 [Bacteroidia bacterium]|nr:hypothetical protein [Bacteroidia bacterium]